MPFDPAALPDDVDAIKAIIADMARDALAAKKGLHEVIQAMMPFEDYHLFEFEVDGKRYGIPDPEWDDVRQTFDAKNIKLAALIDRDVSRFAYTYDFGDIWQHTVTIERLVPPIPRSTIRASSTARAMHRPRMSAGSPDSKSSSTS